MTLRMKVFILTFGEYSDRSVYGVYSTEARAKEAALEHVKAVTYHYCADISTVWMDAAAVEYPEYLWTSDTIRSQGLGDDEEPGIVWRKME